MIVTLASAFRDSVRNLDGYLARLDALRSLLLSRGDALTVVWGEGDSTDDTRTLLNAELESGNFDGELVDVTHGGPRYGSVVNGERFAQLAYVWNRIWERIPENSDVVIFVEPDLVWKPEDMLTLVDQTADYPAVCGMVLHRLHHSGFYDVWAYMKNGRNFTYRAPHHMMLPYVEPGAMVELDSAGSCLVLRGELARRLTWPEKDVVKGLCRQIRELGESIWLNTGIRITHP